MDALPVAMDAVENEPPSGDDDVDGQPMEGSADENEDLDGVPLSIPVASILAATGVQVDDDDDDDEGNSTGTLHLLLIRWVCSHLHSHFSQISMAHRLQTRISMASQLLRRILMEFPYSTGFRSLEVVML